MIERKVICDVSGKELTEKDLQQMTVCSIAYNKIEEIDYEGKKIKIVKDVERYELHICASKAPMFMEKIKEALKDLKE